MSDHDDNRPRLEWFDEETNAEISFSWIAEKNAVHVEINRTVPRTGKRWLLTYDLPAHSAEQMAETMLLWTRTHAAKAKTE